MFKRDEWEELFISKPLGEFGLVRNCVSVTSTRIRRRIKGGGSSKKVGFLPAAVSAVNKKPMICSTVVQLSEQ